MIVQRSAICNRVLSDDALGSVRQMVDAAGAVTLAKSYAPYGEVLSSAGDGASAYGYTGEQQDVSGLVYLRARYYAPWDGRFVSRDTWEGVSTRPVSYHRWVYGEGNPVNVSDPSGQYPCSACRDAPAGWAYASCMTYCENETPIPAYCYNIPIRYWPYAPGCPGYCYPTTPTPVVPNITTYNEKVSPPGISWVPAANPVTYAIIYRYGDRRKPVPPGTDKSQYYVRDNASFGLCGLVAVAAMVRPYTGMSANEVVDKFMTSTGRQDPNYQGMGELARFINKDFGQYFTAESGYTTTFLPVLRDEHSLWKDEGKSLLGDQLNLWMRSGDLVMPLVLINGSTGKVEKAGNAPHWVVITGTSHQWGSEAWDSPWNWVRIYNPFDNDVEYYPWRDFLHSWNADGNMMVLVH